MCFNGYVYMRPHHRSLEKKGDTGSDKRKKRTTAKWFGLPISRWDMRFKYI